MGRPEMALLIDKTIKDINNRINKLEWEDVDLILSDGKLVIEFEDRTTYIINRQGAADQIWLAEPQGGWHFNYVEEQWRCDKRGVELISVLEDLLGAKRGEVVNLSVN
jgi:CyaY protein